MRAAPRSPGHRTGMARDMQKSRVYGAERSLRSMLDLAAGTGAQPIVEIHGSAIVLPIERKFADLPSIQRYIDAVLASPDVRAAWPDRAAISVTARARRGDAHAHYEAFSRTIAIPVNPGQSRWAMREVVLLHEIAHHLTPRGSSHGPEYAGAFIDLVGIVMGPEAALLLRISMHEAGVKVA